MLKYLLTVLILATAGTAASASPVPPKGVDAVAARILPLAASATFADPRSHRLSSAFLVGQWTDNGDCNNVIQFRGDGRFVLSNGQMGKWSLKGDQLSFSSASTVTSKIEVVNADEVKLTHKDGSTGGSTRCPSKTGNLKPLVNAAYLIGIWTDNGNCSDNVRFYDTGSFRTSDGASGQWTLSGDQLTFKGQSSITARIEAVGLDEIKLTHKDGSVGGSTRCPS